MTFESAQEIVSEDVELLSLSATVIDLENMGLAYSLVWSLFNFVCTHDSEVVGTVTKLRTHHRTQNR